MTYEELFNSFKKWNPKVGEMVVDYRPWGSSSIVVWLRNGQKYKVKMYGRDKFIMQTVTDEDIKKHFDAKENE